MKCPSCSVEVRVFSPEWQAQRESPVKKCPVCARDVEVEVVFRAKPFFVWFLLSGLAVAGVMLAFGTSPPAAVLYGLMSGMMIALFPSLELQTVNRNKTGVRAVLNKPINLPAWLSPGPWLRSLGRALWALGSFVTLIAVIGFGVPPPWSGFLLAAFGALGLWRREVSLSWFTLKGSGAVAYAGALLLTGLVLVVRYYA
jgi:hypothetical protein